jgi:DNA-binding beta-propeller fold protein YncE
LFSPEDLTLGPDGSLFVATMATSTFDGKIAHFDATTGANLGDFVTHGSGGLSRPSGIAFGQDGNLYVSDITLGAVLRYDGRTGAFLGTFSSGLTLSFAAGMQFGPDNNLYVADTNGSRVAEFDGTTGALIKTIATPSVAPGDVAFDSTGVLYVTDSGPGARIMLYNAQTGASLGRFDSANTGTTPQLANPEFITYVAPEPSSALLGCGGGLLLLLGTRRRRRAAAGC